MKEYILMEATSSSKKYQKKYKCPYCDLRFIRSKLPGHIQDKHEDLIPEGYTALRVAFNTINNKDHGSCIICGNETAWNEIKGRYERLCEDPTCKEKYKQMVAERNRKKYGTDRLQTDDRYASDVQKKALAGRKISGKYKFADGGEIEYVGSYERKLLEFMDKIMKCNSEDILAPGPDIKYMWEGKEHLYLPDFYYIPYNLIIEVKDGQGNKNQNPNVLAYNDERQKAKEQAVIDSKKYSYVKITNNDFSQLIGVFGVLKYQLLEKDPDPVIRINEFSIKEDMSGTIGAALPLTPSPIPYESNKDNYYIIQHMQNNVFNYSITKDPTQYTMYSIDPEHGYKVFKSDKDKIQKSYLTFKLKDKRSAKEIYDEISDCFKSGKSVPSMNYIYEKYTGNKIISEDQILFDDKLELIPNFYDGINEMCNELYKYLTPSGLDILEEQVNQLKEVVYFG